MSSQVTVTDGNELVEISTNYVIVETEMAGSPCRVVVDREDSAYVRVTVWRDDEIAFDLEVPK